MTYREHRAQLLAELWALDQRAQAEILDLRRRLQAEIDDLEQRSERAYFEGLLEGRSTKEAVELSGVSSAWFHRKLRALGISVRYHTANRGNSAWQALGDSQ